MNVGYMGAAGSFSDVAAHELIKETGQEEVRYVPLISAKSVRDSLLAGEIEYGVLAVENNTAGPVEEVEEAFAGQAYKVMAECVLPIHHCLFKRRAEIPMEALTCVASHQQALIQTRNTRAERYPALQESEIDDTALGAQQLAEGRLPDTTAVICSRKAGEMWGLDLIEENIEDSDSNHTLFQLVRL